VEFLGVMLLKRLVPGERLPASPFATCVLAVVVFPALGWLASLHLGVSGLWSLLC
jgi:hypothetical protein